MSDVLTRKPNDDEIPALRGIWENVFGTIGEDSFFLHYYTSDLCVVAEYNNAPAAVGYLIPFGDILCRSKEYPCAMIYSVATLPEYRGMGLGTAVVRNLINLARELAFPAVILCPNNDKLFEYYSSRTGLYDWFYVNEQVINEVPADTAFTALTEISVNEYHTRRERLLEGTVHIRHDLRALEYQAMLCNELGGGFFKIGDTIAVVECQQNGEVWIKEILSPDNRNTGSDPYLHIADAVAAISSSFPARLYVARFPSQIGTGRRFGMVTFPDNSQFDPCLTGSAPWFGMAFD